MPPPADQAASKTPSQPQGSLYILRQHRLDPDDGSAPPGLRKKQHAARHSLCHDHRIVARSAHHAHRLLSGTSNCCSSNSVSSHPSGPPLDASVCSPANATPRLSAARWPRMQNLFERRAPHRIIGMTQIERRLDLSGNHVARAGSSSRTLPTVATRPSFAAWRSAPLRRSTPPRPPAHHDAAASASCRVVRLACELSAEAISARRWPRPLRAQASLSSTGPCSIWNSRYANVIGAKPVPPSSRRGQAESLESPRSH